MNKRDRAIDAENRHGRALPDQPWEVREPALRRLFEEISPQYDRLNHWLSFGLDAGWRRWAVRWLDGSAHPGGILADVASGTGDLAVPLRRVSPGLVLRLDLSSVLLRMGTTKLCRRRSATLESERKRRAAPAADAPVACQMEALPIRSARLHGIVQGFALRHCRDYGEFFRELYRVLVPGGRVSLLDMRYPRAGFGSGLYRFYFRRVLPRLAALLGGQRDAYEMMVDSVRSLPPEEDLLRLLREAGFTDVRSHRGTLGAVRLLTGRRPDAE